MSVTFELVDTPYVEVFICGDGIEEGYTDMEPASGYISINLANTNAYDLLLLLNRGKDAKRMHGTWSLEIVPELLGLTRKLKSIEFEKETIVNGNFVYNGRTKEQAASTLGRLQALLEDAIKREKGVTFS